MPTTTARIHHSRPSVAPPNARPFCPAAAIGRQLAAVTGALDAGDHAVGADDDLGFAARRDRLARELEDLTQQLLSQVQWVAPESLEGLTVLALALNDVIGDVVEAYDLGASDDGRRVRRLLDRLIDGIGRLGGRTPEAMGLGYFWATKFQTHPAVGGAAEILIPSLDID